MDLSQLGASGAVVVVVVVFLRYMQAQADYQSRAFEKLTSSIDKNTAVTKETHDFLQNLNGSLRKVVKEKQEK